MFIPVIKDDKCTNCKACSRICPKLVFRDEDSEVRVSDPSCCTGCESCTAVCSYGAIKVEEV